MAGACLTLRSTLRGTRGGREARRSARGELKSCAALRHTRPDGHEYGYRETSRGCGCGAAVPGGGVKVVRRTLKFEARGLA